MGKLILTSGGYLDGQRGEVCDRIIEKYSNDKKILIIDNAVLTGSNVKGLPILRGNFEKIAKNVDVLTLTKDNLQEVFSYDVVYITGGDLLPFIELISQCDLKQIFTKYLKLSGVIIGESAGSMIFGFDLKWTYDIKKGIKPKYDIVLPNYSGLGMVDINFFPHWQKASDEMRQKVESYEKEHNIKISRVNDGEFFEIEFNNENIFNNN